jgi:hypothetical protein
MSEGEALFLLLILVVPLLAFALGQNTHDEWRP